MKVIINGVEIEVMGGSRLVYDAEVDTLSVDPITSPGKQNARKQKEEIIQEKFDKELKKPKNSKLSQAQLREAIVEHVSLSKDWSAQQFITTHCLGQGASSANKKYLKLLLDKMVEEKILAYSNETARSRYKMA